MAKAQRAAYGNPRADGHKSFAKRMCNHVAIALVVYTLMLIFVTSPAMDSGMSIYPYFILVLFVAIAIPFLRNMERCWQALEKTELGTGGLQSRFKVDLIKLWSLAIGLPVILSLIIRAIP